MRTTHSIPKHERREHPHFAFTHRKHRHTRFPRSLLDHRCIRPILEQLNDIVCDLSLIPILHKQIENQHARTRTHTHTHTHTHLGEELLLLGLRAVVLDVRHDNVGVQRKARAGAAAVCVCVGGWVWLGGCVECARVRMCGGGGGAVMWWACMLSECVCAFSMGACGRECKGVCRYRYVCVRAQAVWRVRM